jgi:hypothetical protein
MNNSPNTPEPDSVRAAMDHAWREHQHSRDQTWKALQIIIALLAGLVAVEVRFHNATATGMAAALVVLLSFVGLLITKHHRTYQISKFTHIMHCEEWLGLRHSGLISDVTIPSPISWADVFIQWRQAKQNTVLFIMRMQVGIIAFAIVFAVASAKL